MKKSGGEVRRFIYLPVDQMRKVLVGSGPGGEIRDWKELESVLNGVRLSPYLSGLAAAIAQYTEFMEARLRSTRSSTGNSTGTSTTTSTSTSTSTGSSWDFFRDLLPNIRRWALSVENEVLLSLRSPGTTDPNQPGVVTLTRAQLRYLLANSFFGNTTTNLELSRNKDERDFGDLTWHNLYGSNSPQAAERLKCQLSYFSQQDEGRDNEEVSFIRYALPNAPDWASLTLPFTDNRLGVSTRRMEDLNGQVFFDFANCLLQIHTIIPSLTQEEVLFSCCPEAFVGMLFEGQMAENEIIYITNLLRFSEYSGYQQSFKFEGWWGRGPTAQDVIAVDSDVGRRAQLSKDGLIRDNNKLLLAFNAIREHHKDNPTVVTGHWGCGAFGGDKYVKFLQQLMAAQLTGVRLEYSTFREEETAKDFEQLYQRLVKSKITIAAVFKLLVEFQASGISSSVEYLKKVLP